jgi:hypothetical protein
MKTIIDKNASAIDVMKRAGTIEKMLVTTNSSRFIISLNDSPLTATDVLDPKRKDEIRCTSGDYFVKYDPVGSKFHNPKYPYTIKTSDMLGWNLKVSGIDHLYRISRVFPEVAWILRNSYFNDNLFNVAKSNPGMVVAFSLRFFDYQQMIMNKMNAAGLNPIENKPFVAFRFAKNLPHVNLDEESFWPELNVTKNKYWSETKRFDTEQSGKLAQTNQ